MSELLEIIQACVRLHGKGFLASADGNVSVRLGDRVFITPSGVAKSQLQEADLAEIDLDGNIITGKPSSEKLMHLEVYRSCPGAKAVVHAHPPYSIAWSIAHPELNFLPADAMSELILAVGGVPFIPYARPSTQDMGDNLKPFLPRYRTMILARHGILSWGESVEEAYNGVERVEHSAQILYLAKTLNEITALPKEEVQHLQEMRKSLGPKTL